MPSLGILLASLSGLFFSTGNLTVKLVNSIDPIEIAAIR